MKMPKLHPHSSPAPHREARPAGSGPSFTLTEATAICHPLLPGPIGQFRVGLGSGSLLMYLTFLDSRLPRV